MKQSNQCVTEQWMLITQDVVLSLKSCMHHDRQRAKSWLTSSPGFPGGPSGPLWPDWPWNIWSDCKHPAITHPSQLPHSKLKHTFRPIPPSKQQYINNKMMLFTCKNDLTIDTKCTEEWCYTICPWSPTSPGGPCAPDGPWEEERKQ